MSGIIHNPSVGDVYESDTGNIYQVVELCQEYGSVGVRRMFPKWDHGITFWWLPAAFIGMRRIANPIKA